MASKARLPPDPKGGVCRDPGASPPAFAVPFRRRDALTFAAVALDAGVAFATLLLCNFEATHARWAYSDMFTNPSWDDDRISPRQRRAGAALIYCNRFIKHHLPASTTAWVLAPPIQIFKVAWVVFILGCLAACNTIGHARLNGLLIAGGMLVATIYGLAIGADFEEVLVMHMPAFMLLALHLAWALSYLGQWTKAIISKDYVIGYIV